MSLRGLSGRMSFDSVLGCSGEAVVSFDGVQFTGKDVVLSSFSLSGGERGFESFDSMTGPLFVECPQSTIELSLSFIISPNATSWSSGFNGSSKSIRNKSVKDCSVPELLFAVRQKVKSGDL